MSLPDEIEVVQKFLNIKRRIVMPVDVSRKLLKLQQEEGLEATTATQAILVKALPLGSTNHPGEVFPSHACFSVEKLLTEINLVSKRMAFLGLLGDFGDRCFGL